MPQTLISLLVIVVIAFVTIRIAGTMQNATPTSGLSTQAVAAMGNFSNGLWQSYDLLSYAPYIIAALVIMGLVMTLSSAMGTGGGGGGAAI